MLLGMATPSLAQLRTYLSTVDTNIGDEDWSAAYKNLARAEVMLAGLERRAGDAGAFLEYRDGLEAARRALDAARQVVQQQSSESRFVKLKTGFRGPL